MSSWGVIYLPFHAQIERTHSILVHTMHVVTAGDLQPRWTPQRSNDGLHLQIVMEAVNALLPPNTAHLVATERNCSIKDIEAIDPHSPCLQRPRQRVCSVYIASENPSS